MMSLVSLLLYLSMIAKLAVAIKFTLLPVQILFTHHLDSHNQFSTADRGTFVTLPNGDDFETGAMPRNLGESPAPYEETWRDLPPREGPENLFTSNSRANKAQAWILESLDGEDSREAGTENKDAVKTFMARIGGVFLVLQQTQSFVSTQGTLEEAKIKTGGEVSAILEEWRKENLGFEASQQKPKWIRKYSLGSHTADLPSLSTFHGSRFPGEGEDAWRQPGSVVSVLDRQYIVRAYEETGL